MGQYALGAGIEPTLFASEAKVRPLDEPKILELYKYTLNW
jgi:hypothetical protein